MKGKIIQLLLAAMSAVLLDGCVTSSTGGFNTQQSEERALQDYLQLSAGYLEQGELGRSRRHLNNALEIDPDNSEAHGLRALLLSRQGDAELADESFRQAIRLDPENAQVRNNYAAMLYAQGRYQEAHAQLEQVVQDTNYRARPQAFENLGLAALRLNRLEQAEYAFSRALRLNSRLWRSHLELSLLALSDGSLQQAQAYYSNYLALANKHGLPPTPRSLWAGLRLEQALGNEDKAREYAVSLENLYAGSREYQLYLQSLNNNE